MLNEASPIIDYYPPDFECDLNGKQQEWEVRQQIEIQSFLRFLLSFVVFVDQAVVLIPFIAEDRLVEAMKEPLTHLTTEEAERT